MLDIIANNDWERPIYFSGGSFNDEDYIWMKDYLQLEGAAYKLVPIYTPRENQYSLDMGRIDSEKMYNIVMNWDWGNGESPDIYHDPETRKNAITYRSNLARLAEILMEEGKNDKAEEILDLAMEKMPVKFYEYYSLLEPYISAYYILDRPEKARRIYEEVSTIHQEYLTWYSGFKFNRQRNIASEIISTMEQYRRIVRSVALHDEESYGRNEVDKFNSYIRLFGHFYSDSERLRYEETSGQFQNNGENDLDSMEFFDLNEDVLRALQEQLEETPEVDLYTP